MTKMKQSNKEENKITFEGMDIKGLVFNPNRRVGFTVEGLPYDDGKYMVVIDEFKLET